MVGVLRVPVAVAVAGLFLAGCSSGKTDVSMRMPAKARGMTCDTATARVTNFGRATTRLYSDTALKGQVADLRGYMFNAGLRRIRTVQTTGSCRELGWRGVYECTSRAQLCGV